MSTLRELHKLGREKNIKYYARMKTAELCKVLGLNPLPKKQKHNHCRKKKKAIAIILINNDSGEKLRFPSIYTASKTLGKKPSSFSSLIKRGWGEMNIGGSPYTVHKEKDTRNG